VRSAGSQGWAGVLNSHFWFDPKANVAGILMTQSVPFAEPRFMSVYENFGRAAYRDARV
jgi:CubicO group peptidase (beta-lactamase class C family)